MALPAVENPSAPEAVKIEPRNEVEVVENFRREIDSWFLRFQNFYDRANAYMRNYRLAHVDLITDIYSRLMTVFGDDIEVIRRAAWELEDLIETRTEELGESNTCVQGVVTGHEQNSRHVGVAIQGCAAYANRTMSLMIRDVFYPTFAGIQTSMSTVPNAVTDALSRGNVLQDEERILEYLGARYEIIDMQWITAVSQLFRWDTRRFQVDGLFMVDEMTICMAGQILEYLSINSNLEGDIMNCN